MTKILNHINTYADLTAYNADMEKDFPNVSYLVTTDEVKWEKNDPYINVCKYNVTSTSEATKLLYSNSNITYQIIDGVKQDTVQTAYTFDTLGEHIVEYKLDGTSIVNNAFQYCTGLTIITIPDSVTSIGDNAFYQCTGLTSITIPDSVTSIGYFVFQNCTGLTSVTIGSGVTSINLSLFQGCSKLTNINIPDSVTSIGMNAFKGCTGLTSVTIPDSVTSIGQQAFHNCGFTSITIPSSVTTIDIYAFGWCRGLTSVTIEATTPPTLGSSAFYSTNDCPIYVPAESVETYKAATDWSSLASRIQPISE